MGIKQYTISELRKKLAESEKAIRISRGAKDRLKNLLSRISKENKVSEKKSRVTSESDDDGLELFGGSGSADKRSHLDQPVSNGKQRE